MFDQKQKTLLKFIGDFADGNLEALSGVLTEDYVAHITNAEGGVDRVEGKAQYLLIISQMNVQAANLRINVPQIVNIDEHTVMVMVEIQAERHGKKLHNFASHLVRFREGKLAESWMVEALPAYSDEFWA